MCVCVYIYAYIYIYAYTNKLTLYSVLYLFLPTFLFSFFFIPDTTDTFVRSSKWERERGKKTHTHSIKYLECAVKTKEKETNIRVNWKMSDISIWAFLLFFVPPLSHSLTLSLIIPSLSYSTSPYPRFHQRQVENQNII